MANDENLHLACDIFEAWVSADNKTLVQYAPERSKQGGHASASCWIASKNEQVRVICTYSFESF